MNETRSNKVLATLSIIDALDFSDDDLDDLTKYLAARCGFNLQSDFDCDIYTERKTDRSLLEGKTTTEILMQGMKELESIEAVCMALPPIEGYNLVALVQAAVVWLCLPANIKNTGKKFVDGFCDRYRDQLPTIVQCIINTGWDKSTHVTEDEFEETLGEKWQRIAQDVEREMKGEVKIILDIPKSDFSPPHHGALCPVNGEPCSKEGEFYYYPDDCPDWGVCEQIANEDDDLEDRCASGFTN